MPSPGRPWGAAAGAAEEHVYRNAKNLSYRTVQVYREMENAICPWKTLSAAPNERGRSAEAAGVWPQCACNPPRVAWVLMLPYGGTHYRGIRGQ